MTLQDVAAELYGMPPAEFVTARTERARQARESGDRALATEIGKLRRPTVAAWAVNLLARAAADDVRALLSLGEALREAQRRLSGEQLRTLTTRRQQLISALTRKTADLAATYDQGLTESVLRDIGSTLQAALADPEVAARVRTGTLSAAASYDGFGPAGLVAVADTPADESDENDSGTAESPARRNAAEQSGRTDDSPAAEQPRPDPHAVARRELEEILAEVESARTAVTSAETDHESATADLTEAESRIATLRAELSHAEDQRRFTAATERATRKALDGAQQRMEKVEQREAKARKRLPPGDA